MIRILERGFVWATLCAALAIGLAQTAEAAPSVTFLGSTTSSDYSDTGLDIGNSGFWFANFNAATPQSGAAIDANAASSLPSWLTVNPTPDTTFASTVTSKGGQAGWATLTLPDGTTGLSGAVVDSNTANNSNNSVRQLQMGPGHPRDFILHIVTDNTAGQHDPASRLRARAERTGVFDVSGPNTPTGLGANMNGTPDVYSFLYNDMTGPAFIKLQLNSGNALEQASIAGFMIDPAIPEPSSAVLLMLGAGVFGWIRRRRG
jgi:hypothetical protein